MGSTGYLSLIKTVAVTGVLLAAAAGLFSPGRFHGWGWLMGFLLVYQRNGVMFGKRLIQASRAAKVADPQLRANTIAFVHNCTVYDLQDGTISPAAFTQSTYIWAQMGTPNPGRFSTWGNPVQVDTCPAIYARLNGRLPAEIARARATLALQMNPTLDPTIAAGVIDGQLEQAYTKTRIAPPKS